MEDNHSAGAALREEVLGQVDVVLNDAVREPVAVVEGRISWNSEGTCGEGVDGVAGIALLEEVLNRGGEALLPEAVPGP
eukprot:9800920-Alexandrium_andersonii.AAC.1